jgi:hypothetical protein
MRVRWFLVPTALVLAVASPFAVLAATGPGAPSGRATTGSSNLDCQMFASRSSSVSTSSTSFTNINALEVDVTSVFGMTVTVSGVFKGAGVAFQVLDTFVGGPVAMDPGQAFLTPPSDGSVVPFSFTWVSAGAPAQHAHTLDVQWRRTGSSGTVTMTRGDVNVLFQNGNGSGTC